MGRTANELAADPISGNISPARSRCGRVAEWLKAPDSKSGVRVTVPWVRIPPLPPCFAFAHSSDLNLALFLVPNQLLLPGPHVQLTQRVTLSL